MSDFTQTEKINLLIKTVFGIQGLSNTADTLGLKWYNEKYSWLPFTLNDELFADSIPTASTPAQADTNVTNNPTIMEKRDIKLSLVAGTNGRGWVAFQTYGDDQSGIYGDWFLPQLFGQGYAARLYEDNGSGTGVGTEITTTAGAWIPAYKLGAIVLADGYTASDEGWTTPLWVRVYRYIGAKGVSGGSAHVSLDDAYNEGRTITADEGPVVINASTNYAPLQITPIAYTPSSGVAEGQICMRDDVVYFYEGTRTKWLSIDQPLISYKAVKGDGNYLFTGDFSDINCGFHAVRNGTIIGITAAGGTGNQSKSFAIRKNGVATDLATFSLSSGKYSSLTTDVDFSAGDVLQVYCSATGAPIFAPRVTLVIAWRI